MRTHADIIDRWPSIREYADDIGVPYVTAQVMRYRTNIHVRHWDAVVDAAAARGWSDITHELLARTRQKDRRVCPNHRADARSVA